MKLRPSALLNHLSLGHEKVGYDGASTYPYRPEEVDRTLSREALAAELGSVLFHTYDTLFTPPAALTPEVLLGDSLDKLEHGALSPKDRERVREIAKEDARNFVAVALSSHDKEGAEIPPSLKDLLLIARACDDLEEPELRLVLQRVVERGGIDPDFKRAIDIAALTGGPISGEYHNLIATSGAQMDSEGDPEQRQIVRWLREASDHPLPHLERMVARSKQADNDEQGTGFIM